MAKQTQKQTTTTTTTTTTTRLLIPNLPNDVSSIILSYVPIPHQSTAKLTCKSWYHFYTSSKPLIYHLRRSRKLQLRRKCKQTSTSTLLCIFPDDPSLHSPFLFDPSYHSWSPPLPRTPVNPNSYSLSLFSVVSLGTRLYLLGGSRFDTRTFPLDRPTACGSVFCIDFSDVCPSWEAVSPMITPRGSFATSAANDGGGIVVAGGGSRHPMFGAAGSRVGKVEMYDVRKDEWVGLPGLPGDRAGCVGFTVRRRERDGEGRKEEFWVMGGYSGSTTILGVLPVDVHCRDLVVLGLGDGEGDREWREVGDMWGEGERGRLGKVVVVEDEDEDGEGKGDGLPEVFMLDENDDILRFNMALKRWFKETSVPRKNTDGSSFGFVAIQGELHVISLLTDVRLSKIRRSRQRKRGGTVLSMQIYNPERKSWRSMVTRTPFQHPLNFNSTVMCTICL